MFRNFSGKNYSNAWGQLLDMQSKKKILSAFLNYNFTVSQWFFVSLTKTNSCTAQFQNQAKAKWYNCPWFIEIFFFLKSSLPEAVFLISRSPGRLGQRSPKADGRCAVSAGWCGACRRTWKALLETLNDKPMEILKSVSLRTGKYIIASNHQFINWRTVFKK